MIKEVFDYRFERLNFHDIMATDIQDYSVVDVYDVAADIGKEFERIIDVYGSDVVVTVMPKIVGVLENLEHLAQRNERENNELAELRMCVKRLESEKGLKIEERTRYEKELEQIEEQWRGESDELMGTIQKLQEENKRLAIQIEERGSPSSHHESGFSEEDWEVMTKLKDAVDKQREQLRHKDKELAQKTSDFEAVELQAERMRTVNQDLRRRQKLVQQQSKHLIEEKVELQTKLQEREHQLNKLEQRLQQEASNKPSAGMEKEKVEQQKDPERPRFTLNELREVLQERNELKQKVIELREELDFYRPKDKAPCSEVTEDEWVVQGPLPCEPDDAPWKKQEKSNIKKFFRFFFGEGGTPFDRSPINSGRGSPMSHSPKRSPRKMSATTKLGGPGASF